ncbi:hypothetical protein H1235_13005 [Pseudoxanthomonas sp. NC8]|nr:hypothetical protein H1235_13005 [Pseudoxanthomonas sp. NC8]
MERNRRRNRTALVFALWTAPCALLAATTAPPADPGVVIPVDFARPLTVQVSLAVGDNSGNLGPIAGILAEAGFEYEVHVAEGHGPGGVSVSSGLLATRSGMFSSAGFNALSRRLGPAAARIGGTLEWSFRQRAAAVGD